MRCNTDVKILFVAVLNSMCSPRSATPKETDEHDGRSHSMSAWLYFIEVSEEPTRTRTVAGGLRQLGTISADSTTVRPAPWDQGTGRGDGEC